MPIGCVRHQPAPDVCFQSHSTRCPQIVLRVPSIMFYGRNGDLEKLCHECGHYLPSVYARRGTRLLCRLYATFACMHNGVLSSAWYLARWSLSGESALLSDVRECGPAPKPVLMF